MKYTTIPGAGMLDKCRDCHFRYMVVDECGVSYECSADECEVEDE